MVIIENSPLHDLLESVSMSIKSVTTVPLFDSGSTNNTDFPQMVISTGNNSTSESLKNVKRATYTVYIDYFDIQKNNHLIMIDRLYMIRKLLEHLKLNNYYCRFIKSHQSPESIDNSTSQDLRHVTLSIDYIVAEQTFI